MGLKRNFKVVGMVKKIPGPCKYLLAPFNFAAGPSVSSQAVILTKFRFDKTIFPA